MSISDLVPWRWGKKRVPVQRESAKDDEPRSLLTRDDVLSPWFDDMWNRFGLAPFNSFFEGTLTPRVDVVEDDKQVRVSVELPGMDENDFDVSLSHDVLTIRGEKKAEKEDKGKNYYRMERTYGAFERRIPLPGNLDTDKIEATYQRGVLTVTLPKMAATGKSTKITVKARS